MAEYTDSLFKKGWSKGGSVNLGKYSSYTEKERKEVLDAQRKAAEQLAKQQQKSTVTQPSKFTGTVPTAPYKPDLLGTDDLFTPRTVSAKPVQEKPQIKKGSAQDFVVNYLNPFGKKGIFGAESIAENTKAIQNVGDTLRSGIDVALGNKANDKFDDPRDIARFIATLPIGMTQAVLESPKDIREASTGQRLNLNQNQQFTGDTTQLSGLQRVGAAGNALINTGGLAIGGSATLLKSVFGKVAKPVAEGIAKKLIKDSLKEGGEEAVQSLLTDLQTTGKFDEGTMGRLVKSAGLGIAGGGVFSGAGLAIGKVRQTVAEKNVGKQPSITEETAPKTLLDKVRTKETKVETPVVTAKPESTPKPPTKIKVTEPTTVEPPQPTKTPAITPEVKPKAQSPLEQLQSRKTEGLESTLDAARRLNVDKNTQNVVEKIFKEQSKTGGSYNTAANRIGLGKEWDSAVKEIGHADLMDFQKNNPGVGILENGNKSTPQVTKTDTWYHGTNNKFSKFDPKKIGSTTDDGLYGRGVYFSNDSSYARQAPKGNGAKYVMEANPGVDNPLDLSKFKTKQELADYLDMSPDALTQDKGGFVRPLNSQIDQFTSHAKEMGHDGVHVPYSKIGAKADELVAFDTNKIQVNKSTPQVTKTEPDVFKDQDYGMGGKHFESMKKQAEQYKSEKDYDKFKKWTDENGYENVPEFYREQLFKDFYTKDWYDEPKKPKGSLKPIKTTAERPKGSLKPLGKRIIQPDKVKTLTGREILFPAYNSNARRDADATKQINANNTFLVQEAINEAKSKNDDYNLGRYEDMLIDAKKNNLSESDISDVNIYLFGEDSIKLTYEDNKSQKEKVIETKPKTVTKPKATQEPKPKSLIGKFSIQYPDIKEIPAEIKERLPQDVADGKKRATPTQISAAIKTEILWGKQQLKELSKQAGADSITLDVIEDNVYNKYGNYKDSANKELYLEYKSKDVNFKLPLSSIGFTQDRIEKSGIKVGDKISLADIAKSKGAIPTLRSPSGVNYSLEKKSDYSINRATGREDARTAKTPEDLAHLAEQLNKAGQVLAISRRGGLKSKKAAGLFHADKDASKRAVKLRDSVINEPGQYIQVLAHELSHAIEFQINGSTGKTYKLFGELSKEEKATIKNELKNIVVAREGQAVVDSNPSYYNKPTEQLARYVETLLMDRAKAAELAPLVTERFDKAVVTHSELKELMDAMDGIIDKGFKNITPNFYRDLRQTFQKRLGKRAGDIAYDAEMVRRAKIQMWNSEVGRVIKAKFKDVKDSPELLFKAAEAIKQTDVDGNIVYGTRDFIKAYDDIEVKKLEREGHTFVRKALDNQGEEVAILAKPRYTEEEGKALFEQLSPEGKQLVKDFVARKEDSKDIFNRELIKEIFKIDSELEGWVHRGMRAKKKARTTTLGGKTVQLRKKVAGAKKQRGQSTGHLEDFRKQMEKSLMELGDADINNEFIIKQLARISKPIAKGAEPDAGWVEVYGDFKKGLQLPGEGGRDKVTYTKTDEMTGMEKEVTFLRPVQRYQVPEELVEHYRNIRNVPKEIGKMKRTMQNINKYWAVNVLIHPGTVSTNFLSGGIQYSAKVLNDFYSEILSGNLAMPKTRRDIAAMIEVLLPRGWSKAPDYLYGGVRSTFAGQFMDNTMTENALQKFGDYALTPMGTVENYWKKVIALSEGAGKMDWPQLKDGMIKLTKEQEDMIAKVNKDIDLYGYDYDNVPMWINNWGKMGGGLVKPFIKYPYKYAKMITNLASGAFDQTLSMNERLAKLLTLTTMFSAILLAMHKGEEEKETSGGTDKTPSELDPRGRFYIGKVNGKELFVRTAKYPFFNLMSMANSAAKGEWENAQNVMKDQVGSLGPVSNIGLALMGYSSEFDKYSTFDTKVGNTAASFMPGFRIAKDVGSYIDPQKRSVKNFQQAIGNNLPIFGDEKTLQQWRGNPRELKIPVEPESRSMTEKVSETRLSKAYKEDILLSALTGIYITRIDPKEAQAQALRESRNVAEETIRAYLLAGDVEKADKLAEEVGFTIPKGTYSYYRNKIKESSK